MGPAKHFFIPDREKSYLGRKMMRISESRQKIKCCHQEWLHGDTRCKGQQEDILEEVTRVEIRIVARSQPCNMGAGRFTHRDRQVQYPEGGNRAWAFKKQNGEACGWR